MLMFELFTKIRLNTENIHTFNMVHLVLGTTVNCLAVWIDSVLAQFCAILARFVQFCTSLSPKKCLLMVPLRLVGFLGLLDFLRDFHRAF